MFESLHKVKSCKTAYFLAVLVLFGSQYSFGKNEYPGDLVREYEEHDWLAACRMGNLAAVQYFIEQGGINVNDYFMCGGDIRVKTTCLHMSAYFGHERIVKYLLSHGAKVDIQTAAGTALQGAAFFGRVSIAKRLLKYHADPNSASSDGCTPLHVATYNHEVEEEKRLGVVKVLKEGGANINHQSCQKMTPLFAAVTKKEDQIFDYLLAQDEIDPNVKSVNGLSPLQQAVKTGGYAMATKLLAHKKIVVDDDFSLSPNGLDLKPEALRQYRAAVVQQALTQLKASKFPQDM